MSIIVKNSKDAGKLNVKRADRQHSVIQSNTSAVGRLPRKAVVWLGCLAILLAEICFYISTIYIRWARMEVDVDPAFFVFFRFVLGFLVVCGVLLIKRRDLKPRRYDLLAGRAIFNCMAVFCFYKAVAVTSLAEGNILNMTYPVFLAVASWFVLKEQRDGVAIAMVAVAVAGIWMILAPEQMTPNINNLWGLASGITAAFAILCLNISRRFHDTETILFYMFGLGSVIMFGLFHNRIFWPNPAEFYYLFWCGGFGVVGQYLLTLGYRYVTAVEGGVLSSSRILMAAVLGPWIALDPPLTVTGWIGAGLILTANVVLAVRKSRKLTS
ncbi:MAG: DMT family transporter [Desulfobacteraceae bacterium]|nr:MAG: DMT family transporter [Desulfobacteraceae bacterium]